MSAKDAVAGDDDLKLVHVMEVWRDLRASFLLDQEGLRLAYLKGLRLDIFRKLCIDELFGTPGGRRTYEISAPQQLSGASDP